MFANLFAVLLIVVALPVRAEQVAPWVTVDSFPPEYQEGLRGYQKFYCVPDAAEVHRPVFPGAVIVGLDWPKKIPDCDTSVDPDQLYAIVLLSKDSFEEIDAWYSAHLPEFTRFEFEDRIIFVKGQRSSFDWNRDYGTVPSVLVKRAGSVWRAGGYQTAIEFFHPAL
jgi:hypothetical protein